MKQKTKTKKSNDGELALQESIARVVVLIFIALLPPSVKMTILKTGVKQGWW
jgi:hypothetical protein